MRAYIDTSALLRLVLREAGALDELRVNLPLPLISSEIRQFRQKTAQAHLPRFYVVLKNTNPVAVIRDADEDFSVNRAVTDRPPGGMSFREVRVFHKAEIVARNIGGFDRKVNR